MTHELAVTPISCRSPEPVAPGRCLGRSLTCLGVALCALFVGLRDAAAADPVTLTIRVVHAQNQTTTVDPRIEQLVKELGTLKFTGYELKDEKTFRVDLGGLEKMQLPNAALMTIKPLEINSEGMLRLELEVKELKFKTVVAIAEGATLALGGPQHDRGALILAITRPRPQAGTETTVGSPAQ